LAPNHAPGNVEDSASGLDDDITDKTPVSSLKSCRVDLCASEALACFYELKNKVMSPKQQNGGDQ